MKNEIRLATVDDIDRIMEFLKDNWKEDHILAKDKAFFTYQHKDKNAVNYVISLEENSINGVLGFITYSKNNSDIAGAIWKALKSDTNPMLGVELFEFLRHHKKYNVFFSPGINKKTIGIYNYLDIYTNHLNQFLIVNNNIKDYKILQIQPEKHLLPNNFLLNSDYTLIKIEENELDFNFDNYNYFIPQKDKEYFIKRYFNHPIYIYNVYGIYKKNRLNSLIVTREVIAENSKVLRVMDYLGDENDLVYISKYLYQIVLDNDYEYVDFVCYGFSDETFEKSCFTKIDLQSTELIAPNYFAPFVKENITINFMADTKEIDKLRICKADGDQDRPN